MRLGYQTSIHHEPGDKTQEFTVKSSNDLQLAINYEHNGRIVHVNKGTNKNQEDGQEAGFVLCTVCNRWLFGEDRIGQHIDPDSNSHCPKNATEEDIIDRSSSSQWELMVWLSSEFRHLKTSNS